VRELSPNLYETRKESKDVLFTGKNLLLNCPLFLLETFLPGSLPTFQWAKKAVFRSVFLIIWHCIRPFNTSVEGERLSVAIANNFCYSIALFMPFCKLQSVGAIVALV